MWFSSLDPIQQLQAKLRLYFQALTAHWLFNSRSLRKMPGDAFLRLVLDYFNGLGLGRTFYFFTHTLPYVFKDFPTEFKKFYTGAFSFFDDYAFFRFLFAACKLAVVHTKQIAHIVISRYRLYLKLSAHAVDARKSLLRKYLYTINHKKLGLYYFYFSFWTGCSGALLATIIRLEMAYPGSPFFKGDSLRYLQVMTAHALIMIFFVVVPIFFGGFANFLLPYHVGSKDVAFPRLNSIGFWIQPCGYLLIAKIGFIRQQYWHYYDKSLLYFPMVSISKFNTTPHFDYNNSQYYNANFKNYKTNISDESVLESLDNLNFIDYPVRGYVVTWFLRFREAIYGSYQYSPFILNDLTKIDHTTAHELGSKFSILRSTNPDIYNKLEFNEIILRNYLFPQVLKYESLGALMLRLHTFENFTNYSTFYNDTHFVHPKIISKNVTNYAFLGNVYNPTKMLF